MSEHKCSITLKNFYAKQKAKESFFRQLFDRAKKDRGLGMEEERSRSFLFSFKSLIIVKHFILKSKNRIKQQNFRQKYCFFSKICYDKFNKVITQKGQRP